VFLRAVALFVASSGAVLVGALAGGVFILWGLTAGLGLCIAALGTGWLSRPAKHSTDRVQAADTSPRDTVVSTAPTKQRVIPFDRGTTRSQTASLGGSGYSAVASAQRKGEEAHPDRDDRGVWFHPSASARQEAPAKALGRDSDLKRDQSATWHPVPTKPRRPSSAPDYERNAGRPGWLYVARNRWHAPGLHKLGQSVEGPESRVARLNEQHSQASHVGDFELLEAVHVPDAYGFEQHLFTLLSAYRVFPTKEFFLVPGNALVPMLQALLAAVPPTGTWPAQWLPALPAPDTASLARLRQQVTFGIQIPSAGSVDHGWLMLLRNECDAPGVHRLAGLQTDPYQYIATVNARQATVTARVGHFTVVGCWSCMVPRATLQNVLNLLGPSCRLGRTSFVNAPVSAVSAAAKLAADNSRQSGRTISPKVAPAPGLRKGQTAVQRQHTASTRQKPGGSGVSPALPNPEAPASTQLVNTCPHPGCTAEVKIQALEGDVGEVRCGTCRRLIGYSSENGLQQVWCGNR
jgi:hypothetical protein